MSINWKKNAAAVGSFPMGLWFDKPALSTAEGLTTNEGVPFVLSLSKDAPRAGDQRPARPARGGTDTGPAKRHGKSAKKVGR
jgi:hypothetical protein